MELLIIGKIKTSDRQSRQGDVVSRLGRGMEKKHAPAHCPQIASDDKGWSPIKAVSVARRGFD